MKSADRFLAVILLFSFFLTAGYALYHRIRPVVDARAYDQIAINLLEGRGFCEFFCGSLTSTKEYDPSIVRAGPAYEFFLAGIYFFFGQSFEAVWLIQALLHILTAYLIYLICRKIFAEKGELVGLIAAALFAFHPDLVEISAMLMTETLYLFLLTLTIYVFVRVWEKPGALPRAGMLGLISGLAILARPPVILFLPVFLFFYLFKRRFRELFLFAALVMLVLTPWTVRNWRIYGQFIPTTLIGEYNLWVGNRLGTDGGQIATEDNPATQYAEKFGYLDFKEKARAEFGSFILAEPMVFAKLTGLRIIRYFSLIRPMGFWFYQSGLPQLIFVALSGLAIALLFIFGFSGSLVAWRGKGVGRWLVVLLLAAPLAIIFATVQSRYRFQIYPLLAIFGADFLVRFFQSPLAYRKTLLASFGVLLLISLVDLALFWPVVSERLLLWFN